MKIVQVMPQFVSAGAEIMCENLCCELKKMQHSVIAVSLFSSHTDITRRLENENVKIIYLDKAIGFDWKVLFKIRSLLKQEKPDIVSIPEQNTP